MKVVKTFVPDPNATKIGYARVSTEEQRLDLQLDALAQAGVEQKRIFVEHTSAASKKRIQLDLCIRQLRAGDVLYIWRLDRIARNIQELYRRIDQIHEKGASFKSITENFDFSTATGKLILGFLGLMADFERQLTIERTKAGMAAVRARGVKLGPPRKLDDKKLDEIEALLKAGTSVSDICERYKVAAGTIYNFFKIKRNGQVEITRKKR